MIFFWRQYFSDINIFLTSIFFWRQYFSDVNIFLTSIFFWHQYFSGVNIFLTSIFFWRQYFSDVNIFLTSIFFLEFIDYVTRYGVLPTNKSQEPQKRMSSIVFSIINLYISLEKLWINWAYLVSRLARNTKISNGDEYLNSNT